MDDTLKSVTAGLVSLVVIHGILEFKAHRVALNELHIAFPHHKETDARVREVQPLGLFSNRIRLIDLTASQVETAGIPLYQSPGGGLTGNIGHLRLHMLNSTFAGLSVSRFDADIPDVKYDVGTLVFRDRILIRGAGVGNGTVTVSEADLVGFAARKLMGLVDNCTITIINGEIRIEGVSAVSSTKSILVAQGKLTVRDGRSIQVEQLTASMDGKPIARPLVNLLANRLNPVLDTDADLHLADFIHLTDVRTLPGAVRIEGTLTIPVKPRKQKPAVRAPLRVESAEPKTQEDLPDQ